MILDRAVQERGAGQVGVGGPLMAEDPDRDPHPAGPRSAWVAAWSAGPEAVVVPAGVLSPRPVPAVFGRGTTTPLSWRHQTATAWTGWQSLGGGHHLQPGRNQQQTLRHPRPARGVRTRPQRRRLVYLPSQRGMGRLAEPRRQCPAWHSPAAVYDFSVCLTAVGTNRALW